jgi:multiple sugar transport system permease protein
MVKIKNYFYEIYKSKHIYLFIFIPIALFATFTLYPILRSFFMSFFDWKITGTSTFIGFSNYLKAFKDPILNLSWRNTILYCLVTVPGQMIFAMGAALLLNRKMKGRIFFRVLYFLPVVSSWVVVSFIFMYLFNSQSGLVNYILKDIFHITNKYYTWMGNGGSALFVIMLLGIWKGVGWSMVIFLAGLQSVPGEIYEAARIDGASSIRLFWKITIPLMRAPLVYVLVLLIIGSFQVFTSVYIMTEGGPMHQTEVVLTWLYTNAFNYLKLGYGSSIAVLMAVFIFIISFLQIRFLGRSIEY